MQSVRGGFSDYIKIKKLTVSFVTMIHCRKTLLHTHRDCIGCVNNKSQRTHCSTLLAMAMIRHSLSLCVANLTRHVIDLASQSNR